MILVLFLHMTRFIFSSRIIVSYALSSRYDDSSAYAFIARLLAGRQVCLLRLNSRGTEDGDPTFLSSQKEGLGAGPPRLPNKVNHLRRMGHSLRPGPRPKSCLGIFPGLQSVLENSTSLITPPFPSPSLHMTSSQGLRYGLRGLQPWAGLLILRLRPRPQPQDEQTDRKMVRKTKTEVCIVCCRRYEVSSKAATCGRGCDVSAPVAASRTTAVDLLASEDNAALSPVETGPRGDWAAERRAARRSIPSNSGVGERERQLNDEHNRTMKGRIGPSRSGQVLEGERAEHGLPLLLFPECHGAPNVTWASKRSERPLGHCGRGLGSLAAGIAAAARVGGSGFVGDARTESWARGGGPLSISADVKNGLTCSAARPGIIPAETHACALAELQHATILFVCLPETRSERRAALESAATQFIPGTKRARARVGTDGDRIVNLDALSLNDSSEISSFRAPKKL
ncbi:hypothetical protein ISCGN_000614 [Ixodes scapularis]